MQRLTLADKAELALPLEILKDTGTHTGEGMSLFLRYAPAALASRAHPRER